MRDCKIVPNTKCIHCHMCEPNIELSPEASENFVQLLDQWEQENNNESSVTNGDINHK